MNGVKALASVPTKEVLLSQLAGLLKSPVWGATGIDARELQRRAENWRPWRAYAAIYLWQAYSQGGRTGG